MRDDEIIIVGLSRRFEARHFAVTMRAARLRAMCQLTSSLSRCG